MNRTNEFMNNDSRGQLILIGGVVIAALLIALVLILNGVLFTENFSTRDQPQSANRVVDTGSFFDRTVAGLINIENNELHKSRGTAAASVITDIDQTEQSLSQRRFEAHGETIAVETKNVQDAWVVVQQSDSDFGAAETNSPYSDVFSWEMATADGIRAADMTVTSARKVDDSNTGEAAQTFRMDVTGDSGNTWSVWIFEHPSSNTIALSTTLDGDGNPVVECQSSGPEGEIDWTEMTIDGNECPFNFAQSVSDGPYTIEFNRGDEISGVYEFVLGRGPGTAIGTEPATNERTVADTTQGDTAVSDEPTAYDGVYSTKVTVTTKGQDLTSETLLFTAPRQMDATESSEKP